MSTATMVLDLHFRPGTDEPCLISALVVNEQGVEVNYCEIDLSESAPIPELALSRLLDNTMGYELRVTSRDTGQLGSYVEANMPRVAERLTGFVANMDAFIRLIAKLPIRDGFLGFKVDRYAQSKNTFELFGYCQLYEQSIKSYLAANSQQLVTIGRG
ncbi:MAG: hypothetical protein WAR37_04910 [Candidatus Microsaccharimonas sp.]